MDEYSLNLLCEALLKIRNKNECKMLLNDLLSQKEIKTISDRIFIASLLMAGKTYKQIEKSTGISSATITKVNRELIYGEGGYRLLLQRLKTHQKTL